MPQRVALSSRSHCVEYVKQGGSELSFGKKKPFFSGVQSTDGFAPVQQQVGSDFELAASEKSLGSKPILAVLLCLLVSVTVVCALAPGLAWNIAVYCIIAMYSILLASFRWLLSRQRSLLSLALGYTRAISVAAFIVIISITIVFLTSSFGSSALFVPRYVLSIFLSVAALRYIDRIQKWTDN
jgi:hypothetical protein